MAGLSKLITKRPKTPSASPSPTSVSSLRQDQLASANKWIPGRYSDSVLYQRQSNAPQSHTVASRETGTTPGASLSQQSPRPVSERRTASQSNEKSIIRQADTDSVMPYPASITINKFTPKSGHGLFASGFGGTREGYSKRITPRPDNYRPPATGTHVKVPSSENFRRRELIPSTEVNDDDDPFSDGQDDDPVADGQDDDTFSDNDFQSSVYSPCRDILPNPTLSSTHFKDTENLDDHMQLLNLQNKRRTTSRLPRIKPDFIRHRTRWMPRSVRNLLTAIANHEAFDSSWAKIQAWVKQQSSTHSVDKKRLWRYNTAAKDKAVNLKYFFLMHDHNLPTGFDFINLPAGLMHNLVFYNKNPNRRERHNEGKDSPRCTVVSKNDKQRFNNLQKATRPATRGIMMRRYKDCECFQEGEVADFPVDTTDHIKSL